MSDEVIEQIDSHEPGEVSEEVGTDLQDADAGNSSEDTGGDATTDGETAEAQTAYQPNYQYKVYDDVKEFPDWAKKLVSDEETEKALRDMFTKADGLDPVKERYGRTRDELEQVRSEHARYQQFLQQAHHYANSDLGTFLEMHQIPKERVLAHARQLLEFEENPQLKQAYDERRQQIVSQFEAENRVRELEQAYQSERTERFNSEMRMALSQPHIADFEQKFDQIKGAGAFREQIRRVGSSYYSANKRTLPPFESVNQVYDFFKDMVPQSSTQQQAPGQRERPHTIPNMGPGRGHSPAKARPRNLEEMKKQFKEAGYI